MHPDRNVTCESRRKMVARQRRERSAGGWGGGWLREPAAAASSLPPSLSPRERWAQGVERLGVILSFSPCPPRVGLRAPTPRERRGGRGQGRAAATYPTPPDPGRIPPPPLTLTVSPRLGSPPTRLPLPLVSTADRRPGSGRGEAIQSGGLHPTAGGGGGGMRVGPPSPVAGQPWGRGGGGGLPALEVPGASCGGGAPLPPLSLALILPMALPQISERVSSGCC